MPLAESEQEALPDFSNHPDYQQLFDTLAADCQNRDSTLSHNHTGHSSSNCSTQATRRFNQGRLTRMILNSATVPSHHTSHSSYYFSSSFETTKSSQ